MVDITTSSHTFFADGIATHNCYMSSTKSGKHAPKKLLKTIFSGLNTPPYQIAFGGGEPTAHPQFPWFLQYTREQETVPNYTTAGHIRRPEVIEATNKYCGGVALTYHAFKGASYFRETYNFWRGALDDRVQLNVHVLFDDNVADNLLDLALVGLRDLNIVLLAYYPDIGRAGFDDVPCKGTYMERAPKAIKYVQKTAGFKIAFSEGLLPYFLLRDIVPTGFATTQEGVFSCYVDDLGYVSHSSFDPVEPKHREKSLSIYSSKFQTIWNKQYGGDRQATADVCRTCRREYDCHRPHFTHMLMCPAQKHNLTSPLNVPKRKKRLTVTE